MLKYYINDGDVYCENCIDEDVNIEDLEVYEEDSNITEPVKCAFCGQIIQEVEITEAMYDDFLDDIYPPYEVGCFTFDASRIIKELDSIAYNVGMSEYEDSINYDS